MGESKRRGSRSDRIKQAMDRQRCELKVALGAGFNPMTLEELRADVGAPASAVFRGYVLHRVEQDDFCSSDGRWVSFPGQAFVVSELPAAVSLFLKLGLQSTGAVFATLWEDDLRFYVSPMQPIDGTGSPPSFH
jgi:hypothetical protein